MRLIINNMIVLGVFIVVGVLTLFASILMMFHSEGSVGFWGSILSFFQTLTPFLFILVYFGGFVLHYLSGRHFLRTTGSLMLDCAAFLLVAILTIIVVSFIKDISFNPFRALEGPESFFKVVLTAYVSPSFFVDTLIGAFAAPNHEKISLCITVFFSLSLQFLGLLIRHKKR